ncbi:MAG: response regulator [Acidobacteria bacterium]|nr:response regulator [Acidobacteriota bacterium]
MEIPSILVAEDDPDTRELLEIVLGRANFRVRVTDDPIKVLELSSTDGYDAVLLDNLMPKMNGIELCRRIRSVNQTIVVLFCSGAVGEDDQKAAFDAGAQGYITKPFEPQELASTLRSVLATHRRRAESKELT